MKPWVMALLLVLICLAVYHPHQNATFVLDDYYTVVRNPLIKNPMLYGNIWTSRLFDANPSSGYIKFGYYRPMLQLSWIPDYRLFGLKTFGYQWMNLLIHGLNCFLLYILWKELFSSASLAAKAGLLFCVLPGQEWVVRYVTGRGDELSVLFALAALLALLWVLKTGIKQGYFLVLFLWALSALTREVAITYVLYAFLLRSTYFKIKNINKFSLYWILIGILPLLLLWPIIPKQGNILGFHVLYIAFAGLCLWMAQLRLRWFILLFTLFAALSFHEGQFWTTEENLLRHTRSLECWPRTVVAQQLLMKYDEDIPAIANMVERSHDPFAKAIWLRRLGLVYFQHNDLSRAREYFTQALLVRPLDVDVLNALAVVAHDQGLELQSLAYLDKSLQIDPFYPDTLRTLGIHYYNQGDFMKARSLFERCLFFDPNDARARQLLELANKTI